MKNVYEYLRKQAACLPDKIAFADENDSVTFKELLDSSEIIGSNLLKEGCEKKPIPILMDKSVLTVLVMMGVACSGGFYIILDPTQPVIRLNKIIETLKADILLTTDQYANFASELDFDGKLLMADKLLSGKKDEEIIRQAEDKYMDIDPLYVLFTSGSTGVPKGVVVSHRSVIDFINEFTRVFSIDKDAVIGNQAPLDFDVSVKDIYSALAVGATVHLIPKEFFSIPIKLVDYLDDRKVTNLTWAVSALTIVSILDVLSYKRPEFIRRIMFSGETMPIKHLNYWRSYYPDASFVNLYGPTEITCNCTYYVIEREYEPGEIIPIGHAFPNEKVFLLDEDDKEVRETGVEGEICVSGTCLALGYYNAVEQTDKVFVRNPLNHNWNEIIYRTGDLAYYDENGELCFTSRKDFQIKHMGHRIELGEIENALDKVEAITRSCCVFDEKKNKIVCFYQGDIQKKEIVYEARKYLQDFMIPNVFKKMDELPVTGNGKLDRKALKATLV